MMMMMTKVAMVMSIVMMVAVTTANHTINRSVLAPSKVD